MSHVMTVGERRCYWERDWSQVPAGQVRKGDDLANHGTVTHVHHGPKTFRWGRQEYTLAEGESFIACGNGNPHGFAITRTDSKNSLEVVGRNARLVWLPVEPEPAPPADPLPFDEVPA
jgi:hypothetical protein